MRKSILACCAALAGCVAAPSPPVAEAGSAPFPVFAFFEGRTEGTASLTIMFKGSSNVQVHGRGRIEAGTLVLDQDVEQEGKQPRSRQWRITEVAPGRYSGTLSDAEGRVTGEADGGRLHLSFRMKGGLDAQQWLRLSADGRSAQNLMVIRKFGIRIAVLKETIRKAA